MTPSDFTLYVKNIPKDKTEDEIKQFIEQRVPGAVVAKINLSYDIEKMTDLLREFDEEVSKLMYIHAYKKQIKKQRRKERNNIDEKSGRGKVVPKASEINIDEVLG